jgi:hypothetical protein
MEYHERSLKTSCRAAAYLNKIVHLTPEARAFFTFAIAE